MFNQNLIKPFDLTKKYRGHRKKIKTSNQTYPECGYSHLEKISETHLPNVGYETQLQTDLNRPAIKGILGEGVTRKFKYRLDIQSFQTIIMNFVRCEKYYYAHIEETGPYFSESESISLLVMSDSLLQLDFYATWAQKLTLFPVSHHSVRFFYFEVHNFSSANYQMKEKLYGYTEVENNSR